MRVPLRPQPTLRIHQTTLLRIAGVSLLVLLALGCSKWTHPSKGKRDYNTDDAVCNREADESDKTQYWPRHRVYEYCMADRGWSAQGSSCCGREPRSP